MKREDFADFAIILSIVACIPLLALLFVMADTQQMKVCVEAGNQWIQSSCIYQNGNSNG